MKQNTIEYNGYMGFQETTNVLEMANASEYIELINEKRTNAQ